MAEKSSAENVMAQLELIETQSRVLQRQQAEIAKTLAELEAASRALEKIKDVSAGNELLVPLGGGIYAYGALRKSEDVLTEIGAGVFVKKPTSAARDVVVQRIASLVEIEGKIESELSRLADMASRIYVRMQAQTREQRS